MQVQRSYIWRYKLKKHHILPRCWKFFPRLIARSNFLWNTANMNSGNSQHDSWTTPSTCSKHSSNMKAAKVNTKVNNSMWVSVPKITRQQPEWNTSWLQSGKQWQPSANVTKWQYDKFPWTFLENSQNP